VRVAVIIEQIGIVKKGYQVVKWGTKININLKKLKWERRRQQKNKIEIFLNE